jgi:sterol 3beta-glucosyltransferase
MRAILTNFGTTGDVLPLLALGHELRAGGHDVVVACSPSHQAVVTGRGLPFVAIGPDVRDVQTHINQQWTESPADRTSAADMRALLAPLAIALPESYEAVRALARRADVLVSGPAQPAARMVHETTAIPFASVQFSNFGGAGTPALQAATADLINPFRVKLGLRALPNPVTRDANSPQLALYAMSRHLLPATAAWPRHQRVVGFFFLRQPEWAPDERLRRFVESGEPPVVVSFGSMPHADPARLGREIRDACALANVRAVLQAGDGLDADACGESVHVTGFVPHDWLFPRASCIVHHGGAGTAAAVFRAGKPSVYVPHGAIFDQTYWARLSAEHGCSPEPVPIQTLTATRLAAAIRECRERDELRRAAAQLGERVRTEPGVKAARQHIEALVRDVGFN